VDYNILWTVLASVKALKTSSGSLVPLTRLLARMALRIAVVDVYKCINIQHLPSCLSVTVRVLQFATLPIPESAGALSPSALSPQPAQAQRERTQRTRYQAKGKDRGYSMTGKFQQQHTRSSTAQLQAHGWQCSLSTFLPVFVCFVYGIRTRRVKESG